MEIELTKFADKSLCEIYSAYLNRKKSGESKESSVDFGNKENWTDPDWFTKDGENSINELAHAGMLELNIVGGFKLTDKAIIYMENRFPSGIAEVLDWCAKIKSAIPFL